MAKTTKEVAEALGMKSREVTTYAKKYGLLPSETFGGMPMWTDGDAAAFKPHRVAMAAERLCPMCGQAKPGKNAEILCTDEAPDAE